MPASNSTNQSRFDRGVSTVLIGLCVNVLMAAVKIMSGVLGNSYALVADGIESIVDIFSSVVVLGGMKISALPVDENHPYGHGKAESLAAMSGALFLLLAAVIIAVKSIMELMHPRPAPAFFTLIVLVGVIIIKELMFRFIFSVGESVNSLSIKTEAWHHRSDALTSIAAFIGISIALIGGRGYEKADDWAALAASGIILFNGIVMLKEAAQEIMDYAPNPQTEETIRSIAGRVNGVSAIEKCRVRKSGLNLFVDIHVEVNGAMPVHQAHDISHAVKDALMNSTLGIADVLVHIEPAKR